MWLRVEQHPDGVRLHLGRWRWHHAHSGAGLILLGAWLIWGDRGDVQAWLARGQANPTGGQLRAGTLASAEALGVTTSHDNGVW